MARRGDVFAKLLSQVQADPVGRRWLYVPLDQLSDRIGPLSREDPDQLGIVLVEGRRWLSRRPYHKQKLALVLANQRHFALEQAKRGVAVRHLITDAPPAEALKRVAPRLGGRWPLRVMVPAERELRVALLPLAQTGLLETIPHEGWLTTPEQFERSQKGATWRMDAFYRLVRRESGILMDQAAPAGGKLSFDTENRQPWRGQPPAPEAPIFASDPVKEEVAEHIESEYAAHPGRLNLDAIPATRAQAAALWRWAKRHCLPQFGPFEDAMSIRSSGLFHTRLSGLMNLHRILPRTVVEEAAALEVPLASREGFIRQVLGWREFVHHVHDRTEGFRRLPDGFVRVASRPGDGGFSRWSGRSWPANSAEMREPGLDGGATPSVLGSRDPLPAAFWGEPSGLACLDRVVREVWSSGYSHHITRLMVLGNLATLLDVSPRQLCDWFWVAYTDAYDWVVEPNVLGMATFALGPLMTTKPYVSGAAYIDRMSDYCSECAFDPRRDCPFTSLYWAFLDRHRDRLSGNPRLRMPYHALAKRAPTQRRADERVFRETRSRLRRGERLRPDGGRAGAANERRGDHAR